MYISLHVKVPHILLVQLHFSRRLSKNTKISNFTKIHLVEAELFNAYGRMHRQTSRC